MSKTVFLPDDPEGYFNPTKQYWPQRGGEYQHRDGRFGLMIASHPHDGAYLVLIETRREEDSGEMFFTCERADLRPARVSKDGHGGADSL